MATAAPATAAASTASSSSSAPAANTRSKQRGLLGSALSLAWHGTGAAIGLTKKGAKMGRDTSKLVFAASKPYAKKAYSQMTAENYVNYVGNPYRKVTGSSAGKHGHTVAKHFWPGFKTADRVERHVYNRCLKKSTKREAAAAKAAAKAAKSSTAATSAVPAAATVSTAPTTYV